jgi:uncharacterized protein YbjT (DUF2867 family)
MILVTGASGKTGQAVLRRLIAEGETVRALVHRSDQVHMVKKIGVGEVLVGDMGDQAIVTRATQGARAVYHICPNVSTDEVAIGKIIVAAAQSAEVERFVFHSVLHPQIETMPHHWQKLRVEECIFESGLTYTILQPTIYNQNVLAHWNQIMEQGIYAVPYSEDTRLSMVDLDDVAQIAMLALTETGHAGATYELVGIPVISPRDIASILTDQIGHSVRVETVSLASWEQQARVSGLGKYQVETLVKMFDFYERYGFLGNSRVLSGLLDRSPTTFADFVERILSDSYTMIKSTHKMVIGRRKFTQ